MGNWIDMKDKLPSIIEVRVRLKDGSEVECWHQSDGDFYWQGGGSEVYILEEFVTHWQPSSIQDTGEYNERN